MKQVLLLTLTLTMLLAFANSSLAQPTAQQPVEATAAEAIEGGVQLFPNPVQDQLNVVSKMVIERLDIYTLKGEILFTNHMEVPEGARLTVNTSSYAKGFYVVKIIFKNVAQPQVFRIYKN